MDWPNVNLKFYQEFLQKRKDENWKPGTGVDDLQWGLKTLMEGAYQLFHDTPAHQDDYESITGSSVYPFSFCSSR